MTRVLKLSKNQHGYGFRSRGICHHVLCRKGMEDLFGISSEVPAIKVFLTTEDPKDASYMCFTIGKNFKDYWEYWRYEYEARDCFTFSGDDILNRFFPNAKMFEEINCWVKVEPLS